MEAKLVNTTMTRKERDSRELTIVVSCYIYVTLQLAEIELIMSFWVWNGHSRIRTCPAAEEKTSRLACVLEGVAEIVTKPALRSPAYYHVEP